MGVSSDPCDVGCICRHMRYQLGWNIQGSSLTCQAPWQGWPEGFSWNMQRSKSQLLCFSSLLLHGNSGLPKVQKGKLPHLFKAWAHSTCKAPHPSSVIYDHVICAPYWPMSECKLFFTSEPSDEMELFLVLYIQTTEQISHPIWQQKNICSKDFSPRKLYLSPTAGGIN